MSRAIVQSVVYRIDLSINVIRQGDKDRELFTIPFLSLTWLIMAIWGASLWATRAKYFFCLQKHTFTHSARFKVAAIIFISLAFGVGVIR